MSVIHVQREIVTWQKELFNIQEDTDDLEENNDISVRGEKKRKRVSRRIGKLECQINKTIFFVKIYDST